MAGDGEAQTLSGGDGADVLRGGAGYDVLYGLGPEDQDPLSGAITAALIASGLPSAVFLETVPGNSDLHFMVTLPDLIFALDTSGPEPTLLPQPALVLPF